MKIGTQNQAFFPENILEKFRYIKEMGFDGFEIDGKLLVNNLEEVKARNLLGTADERLSQLRRFNRPGGDLCQ